MEKYIMPGLIANAATLGIHWIYDHRYIEKLSKNQSIFFRIQTKEVYDQANESFYSYPNHEVGAVTVQGEILKWLYKAMKVNPQLSKDDYAKILFEEFKPGGNYKGYVESYAKKQVINTLAKTLNIPIDDFPMMDDHLVSFMPYLVCKELNMPTYKAFELAQVYTHDEDYLTYFKMFDRLFDLMGNMPLKEAIEQVISYGPIKYHTALRKAIEMDDSNLFIDTYAGRACAIKYSIPLIIHVLYHTDSYENAVLYNAMLGGAISDRNTLIGAIYAQKSPVPKVWYDLVSLKIKQGLI